MTPSLTRLILVVALLALSLGGYAWWYRWIATESTLVARLAQEIEAKNEAAKRTSAVAEALAELAKNQGAVEEYFISESNIVSFLEELETIGSGIGARVRVASVGAPVGQGSQVLPVSLSIEGSFDTVMRTVGAIEKAPYSITVSSLSLAKNSTASWSASVGITVGSLFSSTKTPPAAGTASPPAREAAPPGLEPL